MRLAKGTNIAIFTPTRVLLGLSIKSSRSACVPGDARAYNSAGTLVMIPGCLSLVRAACGLGER